jgi:hypothetical protein
VPKLHRRNKSLEEANNGIPRQRSNGYMGRWKIFTWNPFPLECRVPIIFSVFRKYPFRFLSTLQANLSYFNSFLSYFLEQRL